MSDESRGESDLPIRPTWRRWFGDFQKSVEALALQDIDLLEADKAELKSTALALFGRLQSELDSALVLIDARRGCCHID